VIPRKKATYVQTTQVYSFALSKLGASGKVHFSKAQPQNHLGDKRSSDESSGRTTGTRNRNSVNDPREQKRRKSYQSPADADKHWRNSGMRVNEEGLTKPWIKTHIFRRSITPPKAAKNIPESPRNQSFLDKSRELKERWQKEGARPKQI